MSYTINLKKYREAEDDLDGLDLLALAGFPGSSFCDNGIIFDDNVIVKYEDVHSFLSREIRDGSTDEIEIFSSDFSE